ncbi:MAG: 23S rRNA (guanosine(2251)-2'-O)-methyltransferase RlmB [Eubacteriales bacterium]|nr:23S rRNA (guanosine(2251)-2'-O)-methyltransferase RlmB [Eubacteriales bacterium]
MPMRNEDRRDGGYRGNRDMKGAARRTYPVREDGENIAHRGGYSDRDGGNSAHRGGKAERDGGYAANRGGKPGRSGGPRVGAIYDNVPRAQRVDAAEDVQASAGVPQMRRGDAARMQRAAVPDRQLPGEAPLAKPEENENLLVGRNPIREALKSGRPVEKLLVAQGDLSGAARDIIRMARDAGAVVQTVDRSRLDQIYPAHQGMLAYVAAVAYRSVDDIFDLAAQRGEDPFIVILDGVTDPHNLGAIIRSAECAGTHGVILPERRAAGLGPAAAKAAAGALDCLPIARVKNLNRTIDELKERGVWVIGTAMDGEDALSADLTGPVALVIGSEGEGISHLTLQKCDRTLTLPMKGRIESLNASVAAGILMYEIVRARVK